jgi:hypothetical protein
MVIRRITVLIGFLLCAWQISHATFASPPPALPHPSAQDSDFTLQGKITEKTGTKLTLSSGENMIFHVIYNDKTEIKKKDGSAGTAADLQIGVNIYVTGDLAESGEITARKIQIQAEGSEKQ